MIIISTPSNTERSDTYIYKASWVHASISTYHLALLASTTSFSLCVPEAAQKIGLLSLSTARVWGRPKTNPSPFATQRRRKQRTPMSVDLGQPLRFYLNGGILNASMPMSGIPSKRASCSRICTSGGSDGSCRIIQRRILQMA